MINSVRLLLLIGIAQIVACSDNRRDEPVADLSGTSLSGVFSGVFPCSGCPGIETTLWVHAGGSFIIEQEYLTAEGQAMTAQGLGRWTWVAAEEVLVLKGAGPDRVFTRPDVDSLLMQTASDLDHQLRRDPRAPNFSATIRMSGMMRLTADGASFRECLSGIVAPVGRRGDYSRFLHQYRSSAERGKPVYVEFDGRLSWSAEGSVQAITIERFGTIRNGGAC